MAGKPGAGEQGLILMRSVTPSTSRSRGEDTVTGGSGPAHHPAEAASLGAKEAAGVDRRGAAYNGAAERMVCAELVLSGF